MTDRLTTGQRINRSSIKLKASSIQTGKNSAVFVFDVGIDSPIMSLRDRTPAEVALVKFPFRNWKDVTATL